jgi:hypothetical protein
MSELNEELEPAEHGKRFKVYEVPELEDEETIVVR